MNIDLESIWQTAATLFTTYAINIVGAILTLIIGFIVVGWITRLVKNLMEKKKVDISLQSFIASFVNIGLKVLLLLSVASMFGMEVTSFVAVFSALAFAVGLALQGNLSNFASGVLILIFKFYKVGDFIKTQGNAGTVKDIQIFHTVLQGLDNRIIIVPNGGITSNAIENFTAQGSRRHDLRVGVSYDADIDQTKAVIEKVIKDTPNVDLEAGYDVFLNELADSSVNFAVRFMTKNENFWPAYRYFMEHIKKELDKANIAVPYPQMDVHLHKTDV
ncbi:MAG: mechanosensitive ion channel domain-containing protein [Bacteroidota bacterium]